MSTPSPESSGLPLRALAMVLLAAAIVFAGLGFISLPGSDGEPAAQAAGATESPSPTAATTQAPASAAASGSAAGAAAAGATKTSAPSTSAGESTGGASARTGAAATDGSGTDGSGTRGAGAASGGNASAAGDTPVRVYNNSTVDGLAHRTAQELETDGWSVEKVANYDGGTVPRSAVYYGDGPGEKAAAEKVGAQLGIPAEPRFDGIADASPGVIVILTAGE